MSTPANSVSALTIVMCLAMLLVAPTLVSCAPVGPRSVPRDRFDYTAAIAESAREELLANLVRLRYAETPVFLTVGSVIAQYSQVASANASAGLNTGLAGDDTAAIGGRVLWAERPTITYVPVSGQEFSKNLLRPLQPIGLFGIMQAGMAPALVIQLTTVSINDLDNEIAHPSRRRQAEPEFREFVVLWRRLVQAGVLGIDFVMKDGQPNEIIFSVREEPAGSALADDLERFFVLLGADRDVKKLRVIYGLVPKEPGEIAVMTHTTLDILSNVAWQFDVPAEHLESGRTLPSFHSDLRPRPPVRVSYAQERPKDAFAAVFQQGYWFYIDANDYESKQAFSLLELLLSLAQTESAGVGPVVTIPTG